MTPHIIGHLGEGHMIDLGGGGAVDILACIEGTGHVGVAADVGNQA